MVSIVVVPHPALRKISKPVDEKIIQSKEFKKILEDLSEALSARDDGVGLSAPQIAINKRVFVVSGNVFAKEWQNSEDTSYNKPSDKYYINPIILKSSKKLSTLEEGCLSIPETYGMVKRPATISIEYLNQSGEKITKKIGGILARIIQHEIDHLDGILFTDKATDIKKLKNLHDNSKL